jgi:mono/diheme cytochrome c family protein
MFDTLGVIALLLLIALGGWLVARARRARNRAVKWIGVTLSSVLTAAFALVFVVVLLGFYKINFPPSRPPAASVKIVATPEQLARGARFAKVCAACHSPDGNVPLVGRKFLGKGDPPAGTIYAPNLTPMGEIKDWSDAELIRAIREGVHKSGRALIIMPSEVFHNLSDDDVHSVVAFLRSQPAAGQLSPSTKLNILGAALVGAMLPTAAQLPITQPIVAPAEGTSAEYGQYLVSVLACRACHGENLAGRKTGGPGPPGGPNLTAIVPSWTADGFVKTLRTGVDPANHKLAEQMPWQEISGFANDSDLAAIYGYLHGLKMIDGR